MHDARLYKRAAGIGGALPMWSVGDDVSMFAGPLHHNTRHAHSVPVLLCGIYGSFRLRTGASQTWAACEAAVIPAGVPYEFNMHGEVLAVVYLEPTAGTAATLGRFIRNAREDGGALLGRDGGGRILRDIFETADAGKWAVDALAELFARSAPGLDPRIAHGLRIMRSAAGDTLPVAELASATGLSASRFQHLFVSEVGVPYRRYRSWRRMLLAIREVIKGANLTTAAHAAGFSDQPHFSHEFKRIFGAPATPSLARIRA